MLSVVFNKHALHSYEVKWYEYRDENNWWQSCYTEDNGIKMYNKQQRKKERKKLQSQQSSELYMNSPLLLILNTLNCFQIYKKSID